ncbi:E3 ubiquitin-protein ligase MARCHF2 [Frankliniella fusca]|uniref:E3 ubiquitin-protein ligase MARCHF2 n=1 Tax=Frankliniella fusca TaxID=407009 RepID=A0AAE1LNM7_9NEOP|nr:E3 ubiquitin-protein ligase MARCHF2 [Frankliniella fusca]
MKKNVTSQRRSLKSIELEFKIRAPRPRATLQSHSRRESCGGLPAWPGCFIPNAAPGLAGLGRAARRALSRIRSASASRIDFLAGLLDDDNEEEEEEEEEECEKEASLSVAVAAADDVTDLFVLDVDDDDLGDDLDTLVSAKSTLDEEPGMRPQQGQGGSADSARSPEYYKGLVKRLEPFAQLAVAVDPRDPEGQSQIRERISAMERFRADIVGTGPGATGAEETQQAQQTTPLADKDSGPLFCRICRDTAGAGAGVLVSPCRCRGSVAKVHVGCLERWLAESDSTCCELCGHQYTTVRTPSYNVLASIPAWMVSNGNSDLLFDFVAFLIFTPVALLGTHLGLSANDSAYFQVTLMAAIDLVYSAWLAMRVHYHAMRWYSWWRRKCTVKIVLDSEESNEGKLTD